MKIEWNEDNAAFDWPEYENARILRKIADDIELGRQGGFVVDINGNRIGRWSTNADLTANPWEDE